MITLLAFGSIFQNKIARVKLDCFLSFWSLFQQFYEFFIAFFVYSKSSISYFSIENHHYLSIIIFHTLPYQQFYHWNHSQKYNFNSILFPDYFPLHSPPFRSKKLPQLILTPECENTIKYNYLNLPPAGKRSHSHHHIETTLLKLPVNHPHQPNNSAEPYQKKLVDVDNAAENSYSAMTINKNWSAA